MLFKNREDAAKKLAKLLQNYKNKKDTIILALPRGGVVVGDILSKELNLKLDIIVARKISSPILEELAIGAICEDFQFLNEEIIKGYGISDEYLKKEIEKEKNLAKEKENLYRQNKKPIYLKDKTIILVDDGIATGSTMIAAINALKIKKVKKIIVAIPVGPYNTIEKLNKMADEVICLYIPDDFFAIAQYFEKFDQVSDKKVIEILK
ncbi:MAG: putative phosphoribosyl transferase [Candidatus Anoxychlamydiales bacterium]|nr:putative phosphoribosyl transferase [Candidatus Anoxychlamydiales bacterium]